MRTYDNGTSTAASPTPGSYLSDWTILTRNTSSANSALGGKLINEAIRYLATVFYFNEKSFTFTTASGTQYYNLPADFELLENLTVSVGGYLWQPKPSSDRRQWDLLNLQQNYLNDYVQYSFIWNGQIGLWPLPATTGNTATVNYKSRLVDMSMADVTGTTGIATVSSTTVTDVSGAFRDWMGQSGWIRFAHSTTNANNGDNRWYKIASVQSSTSLTLESPYQGATITSAGTYTIGDVPILPEDYQDMPFYRAAYIYFNSINPNPTQAQLYQTLYDASYKALEAKYGSKDYSPVLTDTDVQVFNPNLFPRNMNQSN